MGRKESNIASTPLAIACCMIGESEVFGFKGLGGGTDTVGAGAGDEVDGIIWSSSDGVV
jgi:hypothetical protein